MTSQNTIIEFYIWISKKANNDSNKLKEELLKMKQIIDIQKPKYKDDSLSDEQKLEYNDFVRKYNYKMEELKTMKPTFYKKVFDLLQERSGHIDLSRNIYNLYRRIESYDEDLKISLLDIYNEIENKDEIYKVINNINNFYSKLDKINSFLYIYNSILDLDDTIRFQFKESINSFIESITIINDIKSLFSNVVNIDDLLNELDEKNKEIDNLIETINEFILAFFHLWFYMKLILNYDVLKSVKTITINDLNIQHYMTIEIDEKEIDELFDSWKEKNIDIERLFDDKLDLNKIFYDFDLSTNTKTDKLDLNKIYDLDLSTNTKTDKAKLSEIAKHFLRNNRYLISLFKDTDNTPVKEPIVIELENRLKGIQNLLTENAFIDTLTLTNGEIRCPRELPIYCEFKKICVKNGSDCNKKFYKDTIVELNKLQKQLDKIIKPSDKKNIIEKIRNINKQIHEAKKDDSKSEKKTIIIHDFEHKIKTFMIQTLHLSEDESNKVYTDILEKHFGTSLKILTIIEFNKICKILMLLEKININNFVDLYKKSIKEIDTLLFQKEKAVSIIKKLFREREKEIMFRERERSASKIQSLVKGRQTRKKLSEETDKILEKEFNKIEYDELMERFNKLKAFNTDKVKTKINEAGNQKMKNEMDEFEKILNTKYSNIKPSNQTDKELVKDLEDIIRNAETKKASFEDFVNLNDGRKRKKSIKKKYNSKSKNIRKPNSDGKKKRKSKKRSIRRRK
jgi:hypothetical protein